MKATKAVVAQRVERVLGLRLNGAELADIVRYSSSPPDGAPPWGVTERQIQKYLARADALCSKLFDVQCKHLLSRHLLQRRRIVRYSSSPPDGAPPWGVTERQIPKYLARADALCSKLFDVQCKHLLSRHLLQRRRLYLRAMAQGDYRLALSVLQDEAKLENLYPSGDSRPGINVNVNNQRDAITAAEIADILTHAEAQQNGTPLPPRL